MVNHDIYFYLILLMISIYDFKYMLIPDYLLFLLFLFSFVRFISFESMYIGMAIFSFPLFLLLLIEEYFKNELIGLGDIKLMVCIGAFKNYENIYYLLNYYVLIYLFALIYIFFLMCILKIKNKYIPFAPMISLALFVIDYVK